jgi:anti-sigma regulatory factor (Ser/Thr protein kinase)
VKAGIDTFVGDAPQFDDITMLAVTRTDKAGSAAELTVDAEIEKITQVTAFIDEELKKQGCPEAVQMQIDVAVDELFGNIARYAYPEGKGTATIRIEPNREPQGVSITFLDRGIRYDPLQKEDPDVTLPAGEREIGGLGIYIVKKSMDAVSYRYEDGQNILCILKKY